MDFLDRLRALCFTFELVNERLSHGHPCFFYQHKKALAAYHPGLHGDPRTTVWVPTRPGVQPSLVATDPGHYFLPPYVGGKGWVGVVLDDGTDWEELRDLVAEAYAIVASRC